MLIISQGYILTSEVDGTIQMKSYLTGNPEIRLALNEDLSIGSGGGSGHGKFLHLMIKFSFCHVSRDWPFTGINKVSGCSHAVLLELIPLRFVCHSIGKRHGNSTPNFC